MKVFLWVVAILLFLGWLLYLLPLGLLIKLEGEKKTGQLQIGFIRVGLFPKKDSKKENKQKKSADSGKKDAQKKAEKKSKKPFSFSELMDLFRALWPPLKKALHRARRGIRIKPLQLSLTLGGEEDPAEAAERYGELQGLVWTAMPALEQLIHVQDPYIHIGIDFHSAETCLQGDLGIRIRLGALLKIVFGLAIPALRWFLRHQKRVMKQDTSGSGVVSHG